jgi:hypothetical protein
MSSNGKLRYFNERGNRHVVIESASVSSDGKVIYQLKPDLKYRPNKLDSSDYPGHVVYHRSTIEAGGPEAERGGAAPASAPGG